MGCVDRPSDFDVHRCSLRSCGLALYGMVTSMKMWTKYVVELFVDDEERDYADPYGSTNYEKIVHTYDKQMDAIRHFVRVKRTGFEDKKRVRTASIHRETTTIIETYDSLQKKAPRKKR